MSVFGVILVRIFPSFSRIRIEYGEVLRISYLIQMRENAGKCGKNADQDKFEYRHLRSVEKLGEMPLFERFIVF